MSKKIILALALAAAVAAVAVPSFASLFTHEETQGNGRVCIHCDGTGRSYGPQGKGTGPFRCQMCNGTGFNGGY